MLAFARKQELNIERVELATLVQGMAELLHRTIGPGVEIETRFPLRLPPVQGDARQIELALMNLIVNARDAMPQGGTVTISANKEVVAFDGELPEGKYIRLVVADEGEGMDENVLSRAIEPFFTTKGIGKGTGLGLPMGHGLAQQSAGVRLAERARQGDDGRAWLPMSPSARKVKLLKSHAAAEAAKPMRILAVDDDVLVLANTVSMPRSSATRWSRRLRQGSFARAQEAEIDLSSPITPMQAWTAWSWPKRSGRPTQVSVADGLGYADLAPGTVSETARLAAFNDEALAAAIPRPACCTSDRGDPRSMRFNWRRRRIRTLGASKPARRFSKTAVSALTHVSEKAADAGYSGAWRGFNRRRRPLWVEDV